MSFHKYKLPTITDADKVMHLYVCDKCGVIIKTDGNEPKNCPVCSGEYKLGKAEEKS